MPPTNGTKRLARTRPGRLDQPLELTASRRRMLELLHRYRYLTARLLGVAYSGAGQDGRGLKQVQNELGRLYHHGYVERHYEAKRPTGEGSDQFIYTLSRAGGRAILDQENYARDRALIYRRCERKQGNYDHHLALASLQLVLELGAGPWTLESFRCDEHSEHSRFRARLASGKEHTVQPDAWVTLGFAADQQALYLFEIDLARKNNARIDARFEAYATHLVSQGEKLRASERVNNVVVVFIAPSEADVERLMGRATPILRRWSRREAPLFLFWNLSDWYETKRHRRRLQVGTPAERELAWSVSTLRSPKEILGEPALSNIQGDGRYLVRPAS